MKKNQDCGWVKRSLKKESSGWLSKRPKRKSGIKAPQVHLRGEREKEERREKMPAAVTEVLTNLLTVFVGNMWWGRKK